jgi:hypothetical protein
VIIIPDGQPPEYLYQYTSIAGLVGMVTNQELWLTSGASMNDTQEGTWVLDRLAEAVIEARGTMPLRHAILDAMLFPQGPFRARNTFLACFSSKEDSLSQWRGYADDGYGVCLQLKTELLPSQPRLVQVQYGFPDGLDLAKIAEKIVAEPDPSSVLVLMADFLAERLWSIKQPGFREEEEWRLVYEPSQDGPIDGCPVPRHLASGRRLVSHFALPLDIDAIAAVWLGPQCRLDFAQTRSMLLQHGCLARVKVSATSYRN